MGGRTRPARAMRTLIHFAYACRGRYTSAGKEEEAGVGARNCSGVQRAPRIPPHHGEGIRPAATVPARVQHARVSLKADLNRRTQWVVSAACMALKHHAARCN